MPYASVPRLVVHLPKHLSKCEVSTVARCIGKWLGETSVQPLLVPDGVHFEVVDVPIVWGCNYCGTLNHAQAHCVACGAPRLVEVVR